MTPGPADTPPMTRNSTPGSVAVSQFSGLGSSYQNKIITALHIPVELADHKDINLGFAWQKYKACQAAIKACNTLWNAGQLGGVFDRKPTQSDIISIFKGKTQWHLTYMKVFPKVSNYSAMVSWLEDQDDKLSDVEIWGVAKPSYGFSDLMQWLDNKGEGLDVSETESDSGDRRKGKGKGKGKGKKMKQDKGKGKEKKTVGSKDQGKKKGKEGNGGKKKDKAIL